MKTFQMSKPEITHAIFDLDGTLLDSEIIYKQIFIKVMAKIGKVFTDDVYTAVTGLPRVPAMKIFHKMVLIQIKEFGKFCNIFSIVGMRVVHCLQKAELYHIKDSESSVLCLSMPA